MNLRNFVWQCLLALVFVLCLFLPKNQAAISTVVTYPAPSEINSAHDFSVKVNNKDLFVYDLLEEKTHNHATSIKAPFTYFSFSGDAKVTLLANEPVETVDIRPKKLGIKPSIKGNEISFNLNKPCNISVEVNGDLKRPLLLFANPLETNIPDQNDPNVIYFAGGKIYDVGQINNDNTNGKTVYIAGGAIVKGQVVANNAKNFKLLGRGILQTKDNTNTIWMRQAQNVEVNGPILINKMDQWTYHLIKSNQVLINNLKILSTKRDGIDINSSQDITISKSLVMSVDDSIAIKAAKYGDGEKVSNVNILDSVVWNVGGGNSLEIGHETETDLISKILFKNIDIIHSTPNTYPEYYLDQWMKSQYPEAVMSIHLVNQAMVKNITYENINIEDATEDYLVDLRIWKNGLSKDTQRGKISGINFKNIRVVDKSSFLPSAFNGFDTNHKITNVAVHGLWDKEKKVTSKNQAKFQINQYVENLSLR